MSCVTVLSLVFLKGLFQDHAPSYSEVTNAVIWGLCFRRNYAASNGVSWFGVRRRDWNPWRTLCCRPSPDVWPATSCVCGDGSASRRPPCSTRWACHNRLPTRPTLRSPSPPPRSSGSSGTVKSLTCPASSVRNCWLAVSNSCVISQYSKNHECCPGTFRLSVTGFI